MSVRRLGPGDENTLRALRLEALADAPFEFDSSREREAAFVPGDWRRWLSESATFVYLVDGKPVGLAGGVRHRDVPGTALLISMWVRPSARGTGAADALMSSVVGWFESEGLSRLVLHVTRDNARARRAYERNGFRATGREIRRERDGAIEIEMSHRVGTGGSR